MTNDHDKWLSICIQTLPDLHNGHIPNRIKQNQISSFYLYLWHLQLAQHFVKQLCIDTETFFHYMNISHLRTDTNQWTFEATGSSYLKNPITLWSVWLLYIHCKKRGPFHLLTTKRRGQKQKRLLKKRRHTNSHNFVVFFLLRNSLASELPVPTLQNTLSVPSL